MSSNHLSKHCFDCPAASVFYLLTEDYTTVSNSLVNQPLCRSAHRGAGTYPTHLDTHTQNHQKETHTQVTLLLKATVCVYINTSHCQTQHTGIIYKRDRLIKTTLQSKPVTKTSLTPCIPFLSDAWFSHSQKMNVFQAIFPSAFESLHHLPRQKLSRAPHLFQKKTTALTFLYKQPPSVP